MGLDVASVYMGHLRTSLDTSKETIAGKCQAARERGRQRKEKESEAHSNALHAHQTLVENGLFDGSTSVVDDNGTWIGYDDTTWASVAASGLSVSSGLDTLRETALVRRSFVPTVVVSGDPIVIRQPSPGGEYHITDGTAGVAGKTRPSMPGNSDGRDNNSNDDDDDDDDDDDGDHGGNINNNNYNDKGNGNTDRMGDDGAAASPARGIEATRLRDKLVTGGRFKKHGRRGLPHKRDVWVDASFTYLVWAKPGGRRRVESPSVSATSARRPALGAVLTREGASGGVPLDGITRVTSGVFGGETEDGKKKKTAARDDGRKLCLVCEGRTVDLEVAEAAERPDWIRAFRWVAGVDN